MTSLRLTATALACAALITYCAHAQQADVNVVVNYDQIPTTNKDLLRDFASDVKTYLSNYNWGGGNPGDKVKCSFTIQLQSVIGDNRYSAQVVVVSVRDIYNSPQSTVVIRFFDQLWQFTYMKTKPLTHNPYTYDDLTSFLDFYMYLIMGYDADSFEKMSGTKLFQKASDVANMGRSTGDQGWQPATSGYSRIQLIDELMSTTFQPVRAASWYYYFAGLDSLSTDRDRGWQNMITAISMIADAKRNADIRNVVIKSFFEAKAKEIAEKFIDYPDVSVYSLLESVDPNHQAVYEEAKAKRR